MRRMVLGERLDPRGDCDLIDEICELLTVLTDLDRDPLRRRSPEGARLLPFQ